MPQLPNKCILCGRAGPLTGEHIWPDWYSRLHPENAGKYELERIVGDGAPTYERRRSLDLKPEVLCDDCNSRWGATFENKVKPTLDPMAHGRDHRIGLVDVPRLAAWATLKAMVAEYLVEEDRHFHWTFFQPRERAYLRQRARPPECVKAIWIGRYVGERNNAGWIMDQRFGSPFSDDPPAIAEVNVVTQSIGQLVVQTIATRVSSETAQHGDTVYGTVPLIIQADWDDALVRVWPAPDDPPTWPPPLALDDEGFQNLVRRWSPYPSSGVVEDDPTP